MTTPPPTRPAPRTKHARAAARRARHTALTTRAYRDRAPTSRWWLLPVLVLAALAAALVLIHDQHRGHSTPTPARPTSTVSASGPATAKGAPLPQVPRTRGPTDPDWLTAAPAGLTWQRVDGVPLPFSTGDGPAHIDGAVTSGYAPTPQGAALAGIQISMRIVYAPDPDWRTVLATQTVFGDTAKAQLATVHAAQPRPDSTLVASVVAPTAFRVRTYSSESGDTVIDYAYPRTDGSWRIASLALTWNGHDWLLTDADPTPPQPVQTDITGYTRW